MSESKPSKSTKASSTRGLGRIRRRRRRERVWFSLSFGLHCLALVALIYLTPVRQIVSTVIHPVQPEATMSSSVVMDVAKAIDQHAADQIKENTAELNNVFNQMKDIRAKMSVRFGKFAKVQTATAAADAAQDMKQAITYMGSAAASIARNAPIEQTDRYQALAEQAQQRAGQKLGMAPFDVQAATAAQKKAYDAHQQAETAHDQDNASQGQVAYRQRTFQSEQARSEQHKQQLQKAQQRLQTLMQPRQKERQQTEVDRLTKALEAQDKQTAAAQTALDQAEGQQRKAHQDSEATQNAAIAAQKLALSALQSAIERQARQMAQASVGGPSPAAPPQAPAAGQPSAGSMEQPQERSSAEQTAQGQPDVPVLYDAARSDEDRIAATLKQVRAMDLAMVRDIKLKNALADIDVVRPVRPNLNDTLLRERVHSGARLEAYKAEVRKALRETNSMVDLAHRMLEMANQSVATMKFGTDVAAAAVQPQRQDFELLIRELAMEDVGGRVANMAGAMQVAQQMLHGGGQGAGAGAAGGGSQGPPGSAGQEMQDIKDLTKDVKGAQAMMAMGGTGAGGTDPFPRLPPDQPALGAQKIESGGIPTQYMTLNTWYTIGPFPNPHRVNIDREFPPDSLVDLDATYIGKGGRTIRWKFVQSDTDEMVPADPQEYGIWYAYTELYSDKPRNVWIALGSDDRGILKINGVLVWVSSRRLKGWQIDEVWRKVHLNKGVNRILYRIENGWQWVGFSLTLKLNAP